MTTLKPCPFCGGEAKTSDTATDKENKFEFGWIGCQECRVFINYINNQRGKSEAIAAWNRRAQPSEKPEPLTLDELRQMDGEPTYTVTNGVKGSGRWELIGAHDNNYLYLHNVADGFYAIKMCTYGKTWLAYRVRPEGSTK